MAGLDKDKISLAKLFRSKKKLNTPLQRALYKPSLIELLTAEPEEDGVIVEDVAVVLKPYGKTKSMIARVFPLIEIQKFKPLIDRKKITGLKITVKDGALACLVASGCGTVSQITGFLRAVSVHYPEFKDVKTETVGQALSRLVAGRIIQPSSDYVSGEKVQCLSVPKQKELLYRERWW